MSASKRPADMGLIKIDEHGIGGAVYTNGPNGLEAVLICQCGEDFKARDWESVGAELDEHLKGSVEGRHITS